jgi:sigma-B regulation protein RsbU (phosphoserine phosphatase)
MQAFDLVLFAILALISANEFGVTSAQKQQIQGELRLIEERLNLARTVQNLLLPSNRSGSIPGADYQYFFESADTVAGDWMYIWDNGPDDVRLFMGDVTGKGPQAALCVSAIISAMAGCKDENLSVEDTVRSLNKRLFRLFGGAVLSVMNVTVIKSGRQAECYNFGSVGWIVGHNNAYKMAPLKGSQIGLSPEIEIMKMSLQFEPGDTLFTFTDGVVEGSRGLRKLVTGLTTNKTLRTGKEFFDFSVECGKQYVQRDDRTMLFIRFS